MKRRLLLLVTFLLLEFFFEGFTFNVVHAAVPTAAIDKLSKSGKYFNNLIPISDKNLNFSYYYSKNMKRGLGSNHSVAYTNEAQGAGNSLTIVFSNETLYFQEDMEKMPYVANFIPGDSLDKWVTSLYNGKKEYGIKYKITEKQSNMYIVKQWTNNETESSYIFYKISNGVPLYMSIEAKGTFLKSINNVLSEAKVIFSNFNSIKSYAENPNIGFYVVSIGSFSDKKSAEKAESDAKSKGFSPYISEEKEAYKVNIAAFRVKSNSESVQQDAIKKGFKNSSIYYKIRK